jgi:2-polyprenyl-6-methoxyphenol hydroxylase-like FAD-dependent oxidoreductase
VNDDNPGSSGPENSHHDSYDVAIVGYGPIGQLLSILLAQQGHRVIVVERHLAVYPLPRAVHLDDEVARILQAIDLRADTNPVLEPYDNWYEWRNADLKTLLKVDWRGVGPSWWHTSNFFSQPELEAELDARAQKYPSITFRRGFVATDVEQDDGGVSLRLRPAVDAGQAGDVGAGDIGSLDLGVASDTVGSTVRAKYLIGSDGANSTIRRLARLQVHDLGFHFDWLILDMIPNEPMTFDPPAWQLCDPARPTTIVPGGPGRRRWEFKALPRRGSRGPESRGARLGAVGAVGGESRQRPPGTAHRVPVPGALGRSMARAPGSDRRGRRAPDAAVRRTGHVRGNA